MANQLILIFSSLLAATATAAAIAPTVEPRAGDAPCAKYHIFLARGNNEPYPGRQGILVGDICSGVSSCDYEDLIYSALYTDEYCQTVYDGAIAGHVQMAAYASRCPDSKLILGGYSQGGQIITDILGGAGGTFFNGCVEPPLPALSRSNAPGNMVAAAIVFGDTRHTGGQPYNYGNGSAIDGLYPRDATMLQSLDGWTDVLRNWCSDTDPICAAHQAVFYVSSHLDYYNVFSQQAAAWVRSTAGMTQDSGSVTVVPESISGTVQNYATVGTATPSGAVVLNPTWTLHTSVTGGASGATSTSPTVTATSSVVLTTMTTSATSTTVVSGVTSVMTVPVTSTMSMSTTPPAIIPSSGYSNGSSVPVTSTMTLPGQNITQSSVPIIGLPTSSMTGSLTSGVQPLPTGSSGIKGFSLNKAIAFAAVSTTICFVAYLGVF